MSGTRLQSILRRLTISALMMLIMVAGAQATSTLETIDSGAIEERLGLLNRRILQETEAARINAADNGIDSKALTQEVERLSASLDQVERRISALKEEERRRLLDKVHGLRGMVGNLQLVARRGNTRALPRGREPAAATRISRQKKATKAAPVNDACGSAIPVTFGTYAGDTSEATNDGQASCGLSIDSPDVWFYFQAATTETITVRSDGSSYDTVVSVHSGCPGTLNNQIICNDDYLGLQSTARVYAEAGEGYWVRLSGVNGATGSYLLSIESCGTIRGTVTVEGSGDPLPSATVALWNSAGGFEGQAATDDAGAYSFYPAIYPGTYHVTTRLSSYVYINELYDDILCPEGPPDGCDPTTGQPVTVTAGEATEGIDFSLSEGGVVTGTVRDAATGIGVQSASVGLYQENGYLFASSDHTDDGVHTHTGLAPGTYYAVVEHSRYPDMLYQAEPCPGGPPDGCDPTSGTPIIVQAGTTTSGVDFDLSSLGGISGTVVDAITGLPVSWGTVWIYDKDGSSAGAANVGSDGEYVVGGLADGVYFAVASEDYYRPQLYDGIDCLDSCDVTSGTPIVIADHATVTGVDLALLPFGRIRGTVYNATTAAPEEWVDINVYRDNQYVARYPTAADGSYTSHYLRDGTYYVKTDESRFVNELYDDIPCTICYPNTGTPVPVSAGADTTGIDFSLTAAGSISGTVTDADTSEPLSISINVYNSDGTLEVSSQTAAGVYTATRLATGSYYVKAVSKDWLGELYDDISCWFSVGCDVTDGLPVGVTVGSTTSGIDFQLVRAGSISGSIVDATDGTNVGSTTIHLLHADGEPYYRSKTFTESTYTFTGINPGDYYVIAEPYPSYPDHAPGIYSGITCQGTYPDGCDRSGATLVTVSARSEISGIDFALERLATISGTVTDGVSGAPMINFRLALFDSTGKSIRAAFTDSMGGFEINGLWPGTYYIATNERNPSYVDLLYDQVHCPGGLAAGTCDLASGTPLTVGFNDQVTGISFELPHSGGISGQLIDEVTGEPIVRFAVKLYSIAGVELQSTDTDVDGSYSFAGLDARSYFVATDELPYTTRYDNELYDDIPCWNGPPESCDPTKGTPVSVSHGLVTRFVDFALTPDYTNSSNETGISGMVSSDTGEPIPRVLIDFWSTTTGSFVRSVASDASGSYLAILGGGTYYVTTDNDIGMTNLIWSGIKCPQGSAFGGDCAADLGDPVTVVTGQVTTGIDFTLSASLFEDGFESGDTSAWSLAVQQQ